MYLFATNLNNTTTYPLNSFLIKVFVWMGVGMLITAFVSILFSTSPYLILHLHTATGLTGLGYIVLFLPLLFVLLMSLGFSQLSYYTLIFLFFVYATLMGASLSFIFLLFKSQLIFSIFMISALMFGVISAVGYFTKTDLSNIRGILTMTLVGVILATLVNIVIKSNSLAYIISFLSVILFCGITAWDIQKLKDLKEEATHEEETKLGILGALTLYLDFINLFLSMLSLFEKRPKR